MVYTYDVQPLRIAEEKEERKKEDEDRNRSCKR